MQISQTISWPASNWPSTSAATQYTVLQIYPTISQPVVQTVNNTTSASLSYDDAQAFVFQVRPSSGASPGGLTYGPEILAIATQYVPCRAYIRQEVRKALADRADTVGANVVWTDDEINGYIRDALVEFNIMFPTEEDTTIMLVGAPLVGGQGQRNYPLPTDLYYIRTVEYVTTDGKLHLYLKEKPFRGGESTATSYLGYPKLGILLSPLAGRYYPGHYSMYEQQIWIDWDPAGDGDYLHIQYGGKRPLPTSDADMLSLNQEDITLISLRTQMSCWLRIEGNDTRLSRWRTREDGGSRGDMPTVKMSSEIQRLYNQMVMDRRELRPKVRRLMRR